VSDYKTEMLLDNKFMSMISPRVLHRLQCLRLRWLCAARRASHQWLWLSVQQLDQSTVTRSKQTVRLSQMLTVNVHRRQLDSIRLTSSQISSQTLLTVSLLQRLPTIVEVPKSF